MAQPIVQGEYIFQMQEMVAGFNFLTDGKFQFFFAYGAAGRNATGIFTVTGDTVHLKSDKQPGQDFTITAQSKSGSGYTLQFNYPDKNLLSDIRCVFEVDGESHEEYTTSSGELHIGLPHCDSIYVQHGLYPDIYTLVKDEKNENNNFTLSLNASLAEVSFKGIGLTIVNDTTITCLPSYFMDIEDIEFIKQQQ